MPKALVEVSFIGKLGKPHKPQGNLLIYVPKDIQEIYGLQHGDGVEVTVRVMKRGEARE